jgi:hypothetical protein
MRDVAAAFNAIAMVAIAYVLTSGSFDAPGADVVIWGSAAAAVVAALVVLTGAAPPLGWVAVGYVLFAAQAASSRVALLLVLLAVAFIPLLPRPRRSLVTGVVTVIATAVLLTIAFRARSPG